LNKRGNTLFFVFIDTNSSYRLFDLLLGFLKIINLKNLNIYIYSFYQFVFVQPLIKYGSHKYFQRDSNKLPAIHVIFAGWAWGKPCPQEIGHLSPCYKLYLLRYLCIYDN